MSQLGYALIITLPTLYNYRRSIGSNLSYLLINLNLQWEVPTFSKKKKEEEEAQLGNSKSGKSTELEIFGCLWRQILCKESSELIPEVVGLI